MSEPHVQIYIDDQKALSFQGRAISFFDYTEEGLFALENHLIEARERVTAARLGLSNSSLVNKGVDYAAG